MNQVNFDHKKPSQFLCLPQKQVIFDSHTKIKLGKMSPQSQLKRPQHRFAVVVILVELRRLNRYTDSHLWPRSSNKSVSLAPNGTWWLKNLPIDKKWAKKQLLDVTLFRSRPTRRGPTATTTTTISGQVAQIIFRARVSTNTASRHSQLHSLFGSR